MLSDDDTEPVDASIVAILAEQDASWIPVRTWKGLHSRNAYAARRDFAALGVAYRSRGTDAGSWKSAERLLAALEDSGSVRVYRPHGRALNVRLTDAGESRARSLAGLPSLAFAFAGLELIAANTKRKPKTLDQAWASETLLAGVPYDGVTSTPFVDVEESLLPALSRQWLESNSDAHGRVYYKLTPAGWKLLECPPTIADEPDAYSRDLWPLYIGRVKDALTRLDAVDEAETGEIGSIPLPVSMVGCPC